MQSAVVSAVMLGVLQVSLPIAAAARASRVMPKAAEAEEGRGTVLARAGAAGFLAAPETRQSPLVTVGEGGEGGKGRRSRRRGRGDSYGCGEPYRYRAEPPYSYSAPPRSLARLYGSPSDYGYVPEPVPRYVPPRLGGGTWVDPGS
jgi:hypothetical protein